MTLIKLEKSPKKKGTCPECNKTNVFRYYEGLPREFGKCERVNNCAYSKKPTGEDLKANGINDQIKKSPEPPVKIIYPGPDLLECLQDLNSPFHQFCASKLGIPADHLQKWRVGSEGAVTKFVYTRGDQKPVNVLSISYQLDPEGKNCKRDKNKVPFSLKQPKDGRYTLCVFGEHLLTDKIVCLVESEKTAVIASFFYPGFDWLATGGANKLTDEKIEVLYGKQIYYLNDADKAGKENSTLKKLKAYKQKYKIVDLFPDRSDGYDLADAIIDGHKPEIKPKEIQEDKSQKRSFYKPVYDGEQNIRDIKIDYTEWTELLMSFGFRRFDVDRTYIFVKIEKQIVAEHTITQIQDCFIDYLKSLPEDLGNGVTKKILLDKFYKSPGHYFNESRLSLLKSPEPVLFNEDTATSAFIYFKNGFVEVNKENWTLHDYKEMKGHVWKDQVIQRDLSYIDYRTMNNEDLPPFGKFMFNISGDKDRFFSLCSIAGYNLHSFFETKLKATVLTDSSISEEAEGRTGKTLFLKGLGKLKRYTELPGKDFDPGNKNKYQMLNLDTQLLHLNDVKNHFPFDVLYNDITEGVTIEKKNMQPIIIRTKIVISTNKTIKLDGASSKDRSIEFELQGHYNDKHQPKDEFGHWFFQDWDPGEWNRFDNFMMYCLWAYFVNGIIKPKEINLKKRKLLENTCSEFIEYMSTETIKFNERYDRKILHDRFLNAYPDFREDKYKKLLKTFTKWLKDYAKFTPEFSPVKEEDLSRSSNINWITFRSAE